MTIPEKCSLCNIRKPAINHKRCQVCIDREYFKRQRYRMNGRCRCGSKAVVGKLRCEKCLSAASRYNKSRADKLAVLGTCKECNKRHAVPGKRRCRKCLDKLSIVGKQRRINLKNTGICGTCGVRSVIVDQSYCDICLTRQHSAAARSNAKSKAAVYAAYGDRCACCDEDIMLLLSIEHIGGRKLVGHDRKMTGPRLYRWLRDNNYPSGFEILCVSCNAGRHRNNGVCPHKAAGRGLG